MFMGIICIYTKFSFILEEEEKIYCVNCDTALTKPITLNDETM